MFLFSTNRIVGIVDFHLKLILADKHDIVKFVCKISLEGGGGGGVCVCVCVGGGGGGYSGFHNNRNPATTGWDRQ